MPVVQESQSNGLQTIDKLSKGQVASVLKEWKLNFNNFSWLSVTSIKTDGRSRYYIVVSPDFLANPFNLYKWIYDKSGQNLNPITAMDAMDWEDENIGFTPREEEKEGEQPAAPQVAAPTPVVETPPVMPVASQPVMPSPVVEQPKPVQQKPAPIVYNDEDDEAATGYLLDDDGQEQSGNPVYTELFNASKGILVDVYSGKPIVVGRSRRNSNLHLESEGVSRVHAKLQYDGEKLILTDLGSTNGTYVNGRRLDSFQPVALKGGDTIAFYKEEFKVR